MFRHGDTWLAPSPACHSLAGLLPRVPPCAHRVRPESGRARPPSSSFGPGHAPAPVVHWLC